MAGDLARRLLVAGIGIPVVLGLLWLGGWPLGILVAVVASLAATEFYRLTSVRGVRPFAVMGAAAAGAVVLLATARPVPGDLAPPVLVVLLSVTLLSFAGAAWLRWPGGEPLEAVSVTVAGVLYTGVTLAFVPVLREGGAGVSGADAAGSWSAAGFVLLPLLVTWAGDSAAYFGGRAFGRRKLAPAQSPGKTVAGGVSGLVGAVAAAVALSTATPGGVQVLAVGPVTAAWIGLLLGGAAQVGDIAESVLKRQAGVKDSGTLLPGHGGFLDRVDSLLFTVPAAWALLVLAGVLP